MNEDIWQGFVKTSGFILAYRPCLFSLPNRLS
jgi:hypothetical protein